VGKRTGSFSSHSDTVAEDSQPAEARRGMPEGGLTCGAVSGELGQRAGRVIRNIRNSPEGNARMASAAAHDAPVTGSCSSDHASSSSSGIAACAALRASTSASFRAAAAEP